MTYEKPPAWWDRLYVRWLLLPVAYVVGLFLTGRAVADTMPVPDPNSDTSAMHVGALIFAGMYWQIAKTKTVSPSQRWVLVPYVYIAGRYVVAWLAVPVAAIPPLFIAIPEDALETATRLVVNLGGLASTFTWWSVTKKK